jgi:hypothetical protein
MHAYVLQITYLLLYAILVSRQLRAFLVLSIFYLGQQFASIKHV